MTLIDLNYDSSNFRKNLAKFIDFETRREADKQRLFLNLINCAPIIVDLACVTVASVPFVFSRIHRRSNRVPFFRNHRSLFFADPQIVQRTEIRNNFQQMFFAKFFVFPSLATFLKFLVLPKTCYSPQRFMIPSNFFSCSTFANRHNQLRVMER